MKRRALIKDLVKNGCFLKRHGSKHDIYSKSQNWQAGSNSKTSRNKRVIGSTNQKTTRNMIDSNNLAWPDCCGDLLDSQI